MPERKVIKNLAASEAGRGLAAETAEIVFAAHDQLATQAFYADVKSRAARVGRDPDAMRVLPGALVVVGDNVDQARDKHARFDAFVHADTSIATLSVALGHDAATLAPDAPLPDIPESNASKGNSDRAGAAGGPDRAPARPAPRRLRRPRLRRRAALDRRRDGAVARRARQRQLQRHVPLSARGLDDVADKVIPELQRRGLFRGEYRGTTPRETLGLLGPGNRFFSE